MIGSTDGRLAEEEIKDEQKMHCERRVVVALDDTDDHLVFHLCFNKILTIS